MKTAIRYYSFTGHTKKLALAIAEITKTPPKTIKEPVTDVDLLFIGGAIYADQMNPKLKEFIGKLDKSIKRVAIFSSSTSGSSIAEESRKILKAKGIEVLDEDFSCPGSFFFAQRGRPNIDDLELVKVFAAKSVAACNND